MALSLDDVLANYEKASEAAKAATKERRKFENNLRALLDMGYLNDKDAERVKAVLPKPRGLAAAGASEEE